MEYGTSGMYGSSGNTVKMNVPTYNAGRNPFAVKSPFSRGLFFLQGQRKSLNIVAILISLFAPWSVFCLVYGLYSSIIHYKQPIIFCAVLVIAFVLCVIMPVVASAMSLRKKFGDPAYQPSWMIFISFSCFLAFIVGLAFGTFNYSGYTKPYWDLGNLAEYKDIDTNFYFGQQLMDAGRIYFKPGTGLDISRSMGFKSKDIYCVAPIVTPNGKPSSIDFWAVGKDCCSGVEADFHCSGFNNPNAIGVLRLMNDMDRGFYRLAVQQAEATYKFDATHPLFFEWVQDPDEARDKLLRDAFINYFLGIASYFVFQGFLVTIATLAFSKLVHYG